MNRRMFKIAIVIVLVVLIGVAYIIISASTPLSKQEQPTPTVATEPEVTATNLPAEWTFVCGGNSIPHQLDTLIINSDNSFQGTGHFSIDSSYTWNLVGTRSGNNISWKIIYTGSESGYVYSGTGTASADGSLKSEVTANANSCTQVTTSKAVFPAISQDLTSTIPDQTIKYVCKWVSMEEITEITDRPVLYAIPSRDSELGCTWSLDARLNDASSKQITASFFLANPHSWDSVTFNNTLSTMPESDRFLDIGDGAYWNDVQKVFVFLLKDKIYFVSISDPMLSNAQLRAMAIRISTAAISRLE